MSVERVVNGEVEDPEPVPEEVSTVSLVVASPSLLSSSAGHSSYVPGAGAPRHGAGHHGAGLLADAAGRGQGLARRVPGGENVGQRGFKD